MMAALHPPNPDAVLREVVKGFCSNESLMVIDCEIPIESNPLVGSISLL